MINKENLVKFLNEEIFKNNTLDIHEETLEHMIRCSNVAYEFGKYIRLDKTQLELLSKSALLHDIGKLKINPSILYKKDRLTNLEFQKIKEHTLCDFEFEEEEINQVIRYHHERPDKRGYFGCDGSKLSDFVKIMSIVDAYDVMSNKRCYKDYIFSKVEIVNDISSNIGKQFDEKYGLLFLNFLKSYNI